MTTLTTPLRNQLQKAVQQARVAAEQGARQALEALAVHHHEPWGSMDAEQRQLRRRLRAHGRQIGDALEAQSGKQRLDRLVEEVGYEFWHRMLFARFLAENELLIEAEYGVPISFAECEQLAREKGQDPWEYAASLAQAMLPQIFRADSPAFQLNLPPEHQLRLVRLLEELPAEMFHASDALGWVYQFWQTARKDEINASGNKIGARELPAVTQLFTEPYMVSFLLDNALGAWWAARRLSADDLKSAESEQELRDKAAIPGVPLAYLRFVRDEDGNWAPAAGSFERWPEQLSELKVLDPCCGSGHFLVAVFLMLVPMRMQLEGLSARDAADAVLRDNVHGLELDQRCVELAAFALALTAWCYPNAGGYRPLQEISLACSGLSIGSKKEEWLELARDDSNLRIALDEIYKQFRDAPVLGSLINPEAGLGKGSLFELTWEEVGPLLNEAMAHERDEIRTEIGIAAKGMTKAAGLLARKYTLILTNVPYLKRGSQPSEMVAFADRYYKDSKQDLATMMISRWVKSLEPGGMLSAVSMQSALTKKGYTALRERLLADFSWPLLARLGSGAFESISGEVVSVALYFFSNRRPHDSEDIQFFDLAESESIEEIIQNLKGNFSKANFSAQQVNIAAIKSDPVFRIRVGASAVGGSLSDFADALHGQGVGDGASFYRKHWEISFVGNDWELYQLAPAVTAPFSGREEMVLWENENGRMAGYAHSVKHLNHKAQQWRSGKPNWGKKGVVVSLVGKKRSTLYTGEIYGENCCVIVPHNETHIEAIWRYLQSGEFAIELAKIDSGFAVSVKTMVAVPFNPHDWIGQGDRCPHPGIPYSSDPTQWIFHGHPCGSVIWDDREMRVTHGPLRTDDTVLQVSLARLLGYRWPAELDAEMELADEQREWVNRCEELLAFADEDGIVCIPPLRGEASAADRLRELLRAAYGDAWSASTERELLAVSSGNEKPASSLDHWLREQFFEQHCKLFQSRPFIWHIWDGRKDGFHALVNYHKLAGPDGQGRRTLESLTYSYLGEWIDRQRSDQQHEVEGSDARLAAALTLQGELEKILEGEPPYDLFVRWKPLHEQPLGWNPDINDGVRLNIRPFVLASDMGRKGAGILRSIVDKTWTNAKKVGVKDRGKEVESMRPRDEFPWFWSCDPEKVSEHRTDFGAPLPNAVPAGKKFDGQRWNNLHYSRAAREAARAAQSKKG